MCEFVVLKMERQPWWYFRFTCTNFIAPLPAEGVGGAALGVLLPELESRENSPMMSASELAVLLAEGLGLINRWCKSSSSSSSTSSSSSSNSDAFS